MKRIIALCAALGILVVLGAGATGKSESEGASSQGPLKITYTASQQFPIKNDAKYVQAMNKKYNIELDIWPASRDEYANQMNMRFAAGDIPDVLTMSDLDPVELVKQGIIMELQETDVKQHMPRYHEALYRYSTAPFKYSKVNGKIYGLPGNTADGIYHFTVIWRDDWLRKVGITKTPVTIDEAEKALYLFTNNDPDGNGKRDTFGLSNLGLLPILGSFGCIPYNNDASVELFTEKGGKIVHAATEPEMKDALRMLAKWYKDGVIDPEFVTGERTGGHWSATQAFSAGRIGFTSSGMYYHTGNADELGREGRVYKMFKDTQTAMGNTSASYVHGKPPLGRDGKTAGTLKWGVEEGIGFAFGTTLAKDRAKFLRILDWFEDVWMTFDNYMSAIYGAKGEDWTYDDKTGELKIGLGPDTKEAAEKDTWNYVGLGYFFVPDLADQMKKETVKYYEFADKVANFTVGYADPVGAAPLVSLSKYRADLVKLTVVAFTEMITGKRPVDTYFDQYVGEWMKAGGTEVLKEANDWYALNVKG